MIRIHTGGQGGRALRAPGRIPEQGRVCLEIEVDGVELSDGQLEGELVPALTLFCESLLALHRGSREVVSLPFSDGACELILARRGAAALLSIVHLGRPARLLVSDLEVELDALLRALIDCCAAHAPPGGSKSLLGRRFERAFRELNAAYLGGAAAAEAPPVREVESLARGGAASEAFAVHFELWDAHGRLDCKGEEATGLHPLLVPGRLRVVGPGAAELAIEGPPFLLLRDFGESSTRLLRLQRESGGSVSLSVGPAGAELSFDEGGSELRLGERRLPCPAETWTKAVLEAATELERLLVDRNPALGRNPHLRDLGETARVRLAWAKEWELAQRPVAPQAPPAAAGPRQRRPERAPLRGELRRISLLPTWKSELPGVHRLLPRGKKVWIHHEEGWSRLRLDDGALLRTHPAAAGEFAVAEAEGPVFCLQEGRLQRLGPGGWTVEHGLESIEPTWLRRGGDAWLRVDGASLLCVGLRDGAERFRLDPPAALRSRWARAGALLAVAADNGLLYAVDMERRELAWRLPLRLDPIAVGGGWVAGVLDGPGGLELVGVRAADRSIGFRVRLPLHEVREVAAVGPGFVVAGVGGAGGEVLRVDPPGEIRWSARPILGPGAPSLAFSGASVFARGSEGACRIVRGKVRWSVPAGPGGAPLILRGMVALPGERLALLDGETGRALLAPAHAGWDADHVAGAGDHLLVADHHGACVGLRIAGGLAVVSR